MVLALSMARIYGQLTAADLGPAPDRTSFFSVRAAARTTGPPTAAGASAFTAEVRSVLQRLPDVRAMAVAESIPRCARPRPSGAGRSRGRAAPDRMPSRVSDDYFSTLGIPIVFGRGFDASDRYGGRDVAVIDLEMARRNWDTPEDAVNARIFVGGSRRPSDVIGVAGSFGGYWAQAPVPAICLAAAGPQLVERRHPADGRAGARRRRARAAGAGPAARRHRGVGRNDAPRRLAGDGHAAARRG
ncbi:MAG: ABC transporter permease [Vicinamibacterales bacterium]